MTKALNYFVIFRKPPYSNYRCKQFAYLLHEIFKTNGVQYYHWISLSRRMYFFQLSYLLREIIVFLRTEIVCAEIGGKFTFTVRVGLPI